MSATSRPPPKSSRASVMEINRQVNQSKAIAEKAVGEAEQHQR